VAVDIIQLIEMFYSFFLLAAQIGLSLVALIILLRWFVFVPYLWLRYDKPIQKLIDDLETSKQDLMKGAAGRGITRGGLAPHVAAIERPATQKIEVLKLKRQHFLDRVNLFLTIASLGK
jgi:hypothetical protein